MQNIITAELKNYEDYLILKNFSKATRSMYLRTTKSFLRFAQRKHGTKPLSQDIARAYILHRLKAGRSWSTINCDYSALRKYFKEVLQLDWYLKKTPRPRREDALPTILSKHDVVRLINHASCFKHQVFITFVYATGLRLSEATNVKFEDIDRHRMQIRIHRGKGAKDRYVQVPACLIDILILYYKRCKPEVYLFNGYSKGGRYATSSAQWTLRLSKRKAKFTKTASIHSLRHAYATHHLEAGTDLVFIKNQLGNS